MHIELFKLIEFKKRWFNGEFGQQRLGQAFYNHMNLHKLSDQDALNNLYELDGHEAVNMINTLFTFN